MVPVKWSEGHVFDPHCRGVLQIPPKIPSTGSTKAQYSLNSQIASMIKRRPATIWKKKKGFYPGSRKIFTG
ncbi:hypothetical protein DPMN_167644 [Dreissena polymorpha]|uniref:Uncharacterized protein n=1 Tax=Dreissena polymorpha TaxID=45954 RepID=A0A9D4F1S7_DREPO|nr:hypothetical protein DPMN_167644 [Dreissena polymorpha]